MELTKEPVQKLRRHYELAVKDEAESFSFEGHELLVQYAKYLLDYLEGKWGIK